MSEDIKKDRSPNYPKLPLEQAVELAKRLHDKIGKSKVKREAAASILGYSGISGASLTTLGAINQYGLIDQDRGAGISISPLALELLHPISDVQASDAKRIAALTPKVFNVLYTEGFHHASEDAIANSLIHNGFTKDGARKAASVYLENISFANLNDGGIRGASDAKKTEIKAKLESPAGAVIPQVLRDFMDGKASEPEKNVLAEYSIPIGANDVKIVITGKELDPADFDALGDYLAIFKREFERKRAFERLHALVDNFSTDKKAE